MKNPSRTMIYSASGIAMALIIVVCVNIVATSHYFRIDLTSDRIFTLSESTRKMLSELEVPVHIRFYFSKTNPQTPGNIKSFASRVEDLLEEYKVAANGAVRIEKLDPAPYSDAEDAATMEGISSQMLSSGEKIYCGISVNAIDRYKSLSFLSPEKENLLEYDITRAIWDVTHTEKKTVGVMSALPVLGADKIQPTREEIAAGKFAPHGPWIPFKELEDAYTLKKIPLDVNEIDRDLDLLILIQPAGITEKGLLAVDQYLMRGGKLVVMLDPCSFYAIVKSATDPAYREIVTCNLPELLKAWGVIFNNNIVVADMTFATRIQMPQNQMTYPSILDIGTGGLNRDNNITALLERIGLVFTGAFEVQEGSGLHKETLIHSTPDSMPVSAFIANRPDMLIRNFTPSGKIFDMAVMLKGDFKTAFPDAVKKAEASKKLLARSTSPNTTVVLIGDTDFLFNDVCVQFSKDQFGRKFYVRKNDNISFLHNLVEYLSGGDSMIDIRCRQTIARPFKKINELKSKSEQDYKNKILDLEKDLVETQGKINKLQKENTGRYSKYIFSPEQQEELRKFQEKSAAARKELKQLRKGLYGSINKIENTIKWLNILFVPLIVIIVGLSWAAAARRRTSSR